MVLFPPAWCASQPCAATLTALTNATAVGAAFQTQEGVERFSEASFLKHTGPWLKGAIGGFRAVRLSWAPRARAANGAL